MCLAIPLRIVSIDGKEALAEIKGVKRSIRVDLIKDIKVGDYVLVHAGFALEKIDKNLSDETLKLLDEMSKL